MTITVCYYAILRQQRGLDRESLTVASTDLRHLYRQLRGAHAFSLPEDYVRPAINDRFCDWSQPLADGDCVVFVPPVAGG